jgi:L-ectoine synthase
LQIAERIFLHGNAINMPQKAERVAWESTIMSVRIIRKEQLQGTSRHIRNDIYETHRFLLAEDNVELTVTDIVLAPGVEAIYGYDQHIEIAYCIEGSAHLTDLTSGQTHHITPGTMWVAQRTSRFRFLADASTRLICVFTPPFTGSETGFAGDQ